MTNFIFSFSRPFPTYFGLKWSHSGIFLIYWIFLLFFLNFLERVSSERNKTKIFIFSLWAFSVLFWLEMKPQLYFFDFFEFSSLFLEFSITNPIGWERKHNFYFFLFLGIFQPILAWNEATTVFFYFFIFFLFFWNFLFPVG